MRVRRPSAARGLNEAAIFYAYSYRIFCNGNRSDFSNLNIIQKYKYVFDTHKIALLDKKMSPFPPEEPTAEVSLLWVICITVKIIEYYKLLRQQI